MSDYRRYFIAACGSAVSGSTRFGMSRLVEAHFDYIHSNPVKHGQ